MSNSLVIKMQSVVACLYRPKDAATTAMRMVHGVSWQLVTMPISRLITFSIAVLQARLLGKAGYGQLGMALSTLTFFGLFATACAGNACTKFIAELRYTDPERAERICGLSLQVMLLLSVVVSFACYAMAPYIAANVLRSTLLIGLLRLCAAALILQTLEGTLTGICYGFQNFRAPSIIAALQVAVWLPLTYLLTPRLGVLGAMLAYTLSHAASAALLAMATIRQFRAANFSVRWRSAWMESDVLWRYSLPMMLHGLLCVPTVWITNTILARQANGYGQLGAYSAAFQFRTAVIQIPMIMQGVAMPFLCELAGARDLPKFGRLFENLLRINWAIGMTVAIGVSAFGRPLMQMFGREFRMDSAMVALVMAVAATSLLSALTGAALEALGMVWASLWANVLYAIASILLAWFLVPRLMGMGLALSFVASTFIQAFTLLFLLSRVTPSARLWPNTLLGALSIVLVSALAFSPTYVKAASIALAAVAVWSLGIPAMFARLRNQFAAASA